MKNDKHTIIVDNRLTVFSSYIPKHYAVFRCKVDKQQYRLPIIFWCIFDVALLIVIPDIIFGILAVLLGMIPLVIAILFNQRFWSSVTYTIEDRTLRVCTPLKSLVINIDSIKKIKREKVLLIHKGRDYSASNTKLRIIYDRRSYIYVSLENEESFVDMVRDINPNIIYSSERGL